MTSRTALVAGRCHPLVAQIVLATERVVICVSRGFVGREASQVNAAGGWQIVAGKRDNGIGIGRIASGRIDVRREAVDVKELTFRRIQLPRWARKGRIIIYKGWIKTHVQGVRLNDTIVGHPEAPAKNEAAAKVVAGELPRTPSKAELRAEVGFLRVELGAACPNAHVGKKARPAAIN